MGAFAFIIYVPVDVRGVLQPYCIRYHWHRELVHQEVNRCVPRFHHLTGSPWSAGAVLPSGAHFAHLLNRINLAITSPRCVSIKVRPALAITIPYLSESHQAPLQPRQTTAKPSTPEPTGS